MDESKSDPNSLTRKTRIFSFSLTIDSPKVFFGESTHRKGKHFSVTSLQNSSSWFIKILARHDHKQMISLRVNGEDGLSVVNDQPLGGPEKINFYEYS